MCPRRQQKSSVGTRHSAPTWGQRSGLQGPGLLITQFDWVDASVDQFFLKIPVCKCTGLAKQFLWVFLQDVREKPKRLFGQPSTRGFRILELEGSLQGSPQGVHTLS